jgi:hypothetical protein
LVDYIDDASPTFRLLDTAADLATDEVWIQGMEASGMWRFHDGTPIIQHFCPLYESNDSDEYYMRLRPTRNFECYDDQHYELYNFVCEIRV